MKKGLYRFLLLAVYMLSLTAYAQEPPKNQPNTGFELTGIRRASIPGQSVIKVQPAGKTDNRTKTSLDKEDNQPAATLVRPEEPGWRTTRFQVETGTYLSHAGLSQGGSLPFWFRTNQYGIVPQGSVAGVLRGNVHTSYKSVIQTAKFDKVDFGYGADVVLNTTGRDWQLLVPEAYVKMRYGPFELYGGRRREVVGLLDTLLSSGSYIWSGNALPIPKVELRIPDYWPARSFVGIKASYSHGFFENSRPFVTGALLHQKSLYVRLGKADSRLRFYGGMNTQAQWGGRSPFFSTEGRLPSNLEAYLYVVSGKSVAGDSLKFGNSFDGGNRVGNHLGSIDGALEVNLGYSSLLVYRQSVYEDGSLYYLTSLVDGLNGISWQNRRQPLAGVQLERLTVEYLHTMSQGGDMFLDSPAKYRGRDNYFNHAQYRDGWSYFGRTLGTPFITANPELKQGLPPAGGAFTSNNRVQAWHMGAAGRFSPAVSFIGKVSYSRNAGTYDVALEPMLTQLSAYLSVGADVGFWPGVQVSGALGWDRGQLLNDALGLHLRIRKTWVDKYRKDLVQNVEGQPKGLAKR
ncbi:capsule assembly Wzi family protein [Telluribacter sp.]|jgi:hypothetical protein|uniref:capsule assembly Wzi family protein n=1 Tax=Telluribacter sp. TaxID=1978767 RepID=UPI002E0FCA83|nr:capsule assembly Wzi family protein [Telluribacter sp.]